MCNLYTSATAQIAMCQLFTGLSDLAGKLGPDTFYPDQIAPIIRHDGERLGLVKARAVQRPLDEAKLQVVEPV